MLKKQTFIKTLKAIHTQEIVDNKVSDAIELISDSLGIMINSKNKKYKALEDILIESMHDKDDVIMWWLYEDVEKKIWFDAKLKRKPVDVSTPAKLYDYLVAEYGQE